MIRKMMCVRCKQNYIFPPTDSTDFHGENDTTKRNSIIFTDKNKTFGLIKICEIRENQWELSLYRTHVNNKKEKTSKERESLIEPFKERKAVSSALQTLLRVSRSPVLSFFPNK